jgi:aryl-alcohol dehydrogenase-like predicted oxidoreductase
MTARQKVARRLLGRTGRTISELGFGCGGLWARRLIGDQPAIDLVHQAIELGITYFDTGASYGDGLSEHRLGRALRSHRHMIDRLIISTKVGTVRAGRWGVLKDFSPDAIEAQLLGSMERLGLNHIPLLFLHGPEPAHLSDETLETLVRLKREGLIGLIGINGVEYQVEAAMQTQVFDVIMPLYNPVHRHAEPLIAQAAEAGLGVIAGNPLARMAFDPTQHRAWFDPSRWWYALRLMRDPSLASTAAQAKVKRLAILRRVKGWSPAQASLGVVLANPNVHCAVFGTTNPEHLIDNVGSSGRSLLPAVLEKLRAVE